tara:strand:+ start:351 stop:581 length:231 start_codon:yes stop_codon:yes gene_type:complete
MVSNASELYKKIESNPDYTKALFRQALQDPQGAIETICEIGKSMNLPVTRDEVKNHLSNINDEETKQWLIKARGGL